MCHRLAEEEGGQEGGHGLRKVRSCAGWSLGWSLGWWPGCLQADGAVGAPATKLAPPCPPAGARCSTASSVTAPSRRVTAAPSPSPTQTPNSTGATGEAAKALAGCCSCCPAPPLPPHGLPRWLVVAVGVPARWGPSRGARSTSRMVAACCVRTAGSCRREGAWFSSWPQRLLPRPLPAPVLFVVATDPSPSVPHRFTLPAKGTLSGLHNL